MQRDIRDLGEDDLRSHDAIFHLAALSNDSLGDLDPELTFEINERASVRLARAAREAGVGRFIFASSCSTELTLEWSARKGAGQLYDAYRTAGLTFEQFEGPRFRRLKRLQQLREEGRLDDDLRWAD